VTITVTCYSWAPSSGDHLFTCGAIYRPPHPPDLEENPLNWQTWPRVLTGLSITCCCPGQHALLTLSTSLQ